MKRRILAVAVLVLLALVAYLAWWPVPIEPVAWTPPPAPELTGPYALNEDLARSTRLLEDIGIGPEDVAFDAEGRLYTGFEDGRIVRMQLPRAEPRLFADTGGRPLGMVFDPLGYLVVADAARGLLDHLPRGRDQRPRHRRGRRALRLPRRSRHRPRRDDLRHRRLHPLRLRPPPARHPGARRRRPAPGVEPGDALDARPPRRSPVPQRRGGGAARATRSSSRRPAPIASAATG